MPNDILPTTRRGLLFAGGALVALPAVTLPAVARAATGPAPENVADAPVADRAGAEEHVSPFGRHQAGILTPRPANGLVAAFHVLADDPAALERLLRRLTDRVVFLTHGGPVADSDPKLPPPDSGILGPVVRPDALTITVGFGASLFDDRPWLAPLKPRALSRMTKFPNDALDAEICHGDLVLQFCAHTQDTVVHALRDILKNIPDQLVLKWAQTGNVPVIPSEPGAPPESARNLLGFRDGSANPDSADADEMDRVVWVGPASARPGAEEPAWATDGSYMAVRLVRTLVERWDRAPLGEQERFFGRFKMSGAPLDQPDGTEHMVPDFAADPDGAITPLDSHIRLANPRTPGSEENDMLRRPFNYVNGVLRNGQLDQGLLFIAWQSDLERAFITVQNRLNGEPLEEYVKPVGGGYFFAPPGFEEGDGYLGQTLLAAITPASPPSSQPPQPVPVQN